MQNSRIDVALGVLQLVVDNSRAEGGVLNETRTRLIGYCDGTVATLVALPLDVMRRFIADICTEGLLIGIACAERCHTLLNELCQSPD